VTFKNKRLSVVDLKLAVVEVGMSFSGRGCCGEVAFVEKLKEE